MAFTWTYPTPLDPNQPSLIGGRLRNVIGTFTVYIQELCDAIDTLRQNIGQTPYNWTIYRPEVGDTLLYEHFRQIQLRINSLIQDYGFNSVVDILGRNWSDYSLDLNGVYYAKYAIIQDFRDVLNSLEINREQWIKTVDYIPFTTTQQVVPEGYGIAGGWQEGTYKTVYAQGDIGLWTLKSINGDTYHTHYKKWGYPDYPTEVIFNADYLPSDPPNSEVSIDMVGYYEDQVTGYATSPLWGYDYSTTPPTPIIVAWTETATLSNESYLPSFTMECGSVPNDWAQFYGEFDKEFLLTENSRFKIDMSLAGIPALVENSNYSAPYTSPLVMTMRLFFNKNPKSGAVGGGKEIVDIVFTEDSAYASGSMWKVYHFDDLNDNIEFSSLPFRTYWSGDSQVFDITNYDYLWTGIRITLSKSHYQLGSSSSGPIGSQTQSGDTPYVNFKINKIGLIEVV